MSDLDCLHCGEPVTGRIDWIGSQEADGLRSRRRHRVCAMREIIGGLNHLKRQCTCCGGDQPPDPPNMSRYQAAVAAVEFYLRAELGP